VNGLITWTGRVGQLSAQAAEAMAKKVAPATALQDMRNDIILILLEAA
jgi:hypothetical protein